MNRRPHIVVDRDGILTRLRAHAEASRARSDRLEALRDRLAVAVAERHAALLALLHGEPLSRYEDEWAQDEPVAR